MHVADLHRHSDFGAAEARQRALHLPRPVGFVPGLDGAVRERGFPPGERVVRTSTCRVGTATDWPAKAATTVTNKQMMAVTISSMDWTVNANSPINAVIAPQAPETLVSLGLRRLEVVFRCVTAEL